MNTMKAKMIIKNPTKFNISSEDHKEAFKTLNTISLETGKAFKKGTASVVTFAKTDCEVLARMLVLNKAINLLK